ncbi:unnamed protein product [Boreogadus saida]
MQQRDDVGAPPKGSVKPLRPFGGAPGRALSAGQRPRSSWPGQEALASDQSSDTNPGPLTERPLTNKTASNALWDTVTSLSLDLQTDTHMGTRPPDRHQEGDQTSRQTPTWGPDLQTDTNMRGPDLQTDTHIRTRPPDRHQHEGTRPPDRHPHEGTRPPDRHQHEDQTSRQTPTWGPDLQTDTVVKDQTSRQTPTWGPDLQTDTHMGTRPPDRHQEGDQTSRQTPT